MALESPRDRRDRDAHGTGAGVQPRSAGNRGLRAGALRRRKHRRSKATAGRSRIPRRSRLSEVRNSLQHAGDAQSDRRVDSRSLEANARHRRRPAQPGVGRVSRHGATQGDLRRGPGRVGSATMPIRIRFSICSSPTTKTIKPAGATPSTTPDRRRRRRRRRAEADANACTMPKRS